jgi:hypothetical protein
MACERYREALADVATGAPSPAGLEVHLAACEACRAELAGLRRALAVADAEMADLLAAEPTPELAVRIRQAVAETESRGSALQHEPPSAFRFGWLWPAMATAATLLVALAVVASRGTSPTPGPRVAVDARSPQPAGGTSGAEPAGEAVIPGVDRQPVGRPEEGPVTPRSSIRVGRRGVRSPGGSLGTRRVGAPRDDSAPEPEVLVPPGEADALLRFVALVHRERLTPSVLGAAGQPSADLAELALIDIKPLEIVPLDPAESSGT